MALGRVNPGNPHETFCMTVLAPEAVAPRQCRLVAARRGVARDVDGLCSRPRARTRVPIGHITNGVHVPIVAGAADVPPLRPPPGRRLARAQRRAAHLGRHREHRRRRAVGDAPEPEGAPARHSCGAARWSRPSAAANRRRSCSGSAACSQPRRADDRLRAALRHLQARQPDPAATSSSWRRMVNDPQASGAVRLRRQGPSARRARQARAAADRAADARPAASPASSSSSRTTTSTSAATSCRASTSG